MTPLIFYLHGDGFRQIGHAVLILLAKPLILLFNSNPVIVDYGRWLLISQPAADVLTILVCVLSIPAMKRAASRNMK